MRVVGYVRVSRVAGREGPSFISPQVQRERIAAAGHDVVEWIEDLDQPGSRVDRPGLRRAMELVKSGAAEGIAVAKLDRFGRSVVHLGQLVEELQAVDGALISVSEGVDTSGHTGRLIANILTAIGEWELGRIRENWASARAAASARGAYLAEAPVGYRKTAIGGLELAPEAPQIGETFRRRASGDSWATIARWLNSEGISSKRGGEWTVASVKRMIANPAYIEGPHPPITDAATFGAANAVKGVAPGRSGRASGLLSGLVRCAGCRYAMKLSQGKTRHGKPFTEYRCKSARAEAAGGRCAAPAAIKSSVIEPFVLDRFWEIVSDYRGRGSRVSDELQDAEQALRSAEAELDATLDRRLADALGGAQATRYIKLVGERKAAVDDAKQLLLEARRKAEVALPEVELRAIWPDLSLYEQRKLLALVFDCVFVRRSGQAPVEERTFVCTHGTAPELPVRGRRWTIQPFDFPASAETGAEDLG